MDFLVYPGVGILAGLLAGLLGLGGGLVVVPALVFAFLHLGFPADRLFHLALGTSMATIIPTSIASLRAHDRRGAVDWPAVRKLAPPIVGGAVAGAFFAAHLPTHGLRIVLGCFELLVATQLLLGSRQPKTRPAPNRLMDLGAGTAIGGVSSLLGIGGGTLSVPYLAWRGHDFLHAVGTASALGLPIALAGTTGFVLSGWGMELPGPGIGYVYLPAWIGVVATSVLAAPLGSRLAHSLPTAMLKRIFAALLLFLGAKMLSGAL